MRQQQNVHDAHINLHFTSSRSGERMTSFHVTRLLLSFTCFIHAIVLCACASASYHPSEPTATLSLVRDPEDPANRYSLQVSTDQINHYLKTLSNVPSSIYDSAHIITDFDESAITGAYSRAPSSPSPAVDTKYSYEEAPRTSDKANLYHESHYGSESNVYAKKTSPNVKLYDEVDFGSSRITANPRAMRTVILGGREYIIRKDETGQAVASPTSSSLSSSSSSSAKEMKDDPAPAKSSPAIVISDSKPVAIEIGQKPASNEYPPSLPSNHIRTTFGLPRETISKEKSEADLEREKDEQNAMEKVQDDLMKELYSIQKHTLNQSPVSNEAVKESDSSMNKDNNNKNEVDLKTVQSLLTTLIKQIEQIQSVAKSLPLSSHSQTGGEEVMQYVKEYVPMRTVYKEARPIEAMPLPYEIRGKKVDLTDGVRGKKGHKHHSHHAHNAEEHQDVFLKAPDLVKMLTGESFEPSEYVPMPTGVNRRYVPMPLSLPNFPLARSSPAFPFSYPMSFPSFPFYPAFKK